MSLDLSTLSKEDLAAELKKREQAELAAARKAKTDFESDKKSFLTHSVSKFEHLNRELAELKQFTILEANKLYDRMYEVEGKEPKDTKSFTLKDDTLGLKVTVDRQERFTFTDEAIVHINAIKDIFREKFANRNQGFYQILDGILMKNTKGDYDPKLLAKARQQVKKLGDDALIAEFDKLEDCQRVVGTSLYARAYKKDENGKYKDIILQFSSL